ncbi:heterocyst differentiation protein [Scytonema hofmannii PCC 7110]|uniref:Heterocyst differentiation protein n=1 Tax=Scytonema hofmannii PCC 7110 TaxID=128403 RepID=A0A139X0A2_9CYAN|nr:cell division protein HetF [Scytonema hofmannii]KYC38090.1 heterocyst differentiation protein [Scytonema hofmannii PCC 7110]
MTQEFHISVTPVGQNDYLVRTEQVAPGVPLAEELVTWPVADWLTAAGHLMNDPLKLVLQGDAIARNSINLVALGQQLYNALFQGTLRDSWITAQGIAQNHQQVLRLRLGLKDTRLARLPWEVMHAGDRPIATGLYIAFSRYQNASGGTSRLPTTSMPVPPYEERGIKVLMVIASPTDLVRLDLLKQEAIKLQAELHRSANGDIPRIRMNLLEQPGREELTQALEQGRYHVLHYSGHSNPGPNGGEIYLVSGRTGLKETLSGDDLAGLLVNNHIQMAVFNSCLGTYAATTDPSGDTGERNLTESLVKRGIKSVLAMSERIPDDVALTLTQLFYRNLLLGYPVDLCVSRMRQGLIAAYSSHQMYWALPILYLQPQFNGYLSPGMHPIHNDELIDEYNSTALTTTTTSIYPDPATDADMPLPIEEIMPPLAREPSELDWLDDLADEIEYDEPSYEEDSAIVSDLFRQIDRQRAESEDSMTAELVQDFGEERFDDTEVSGEIASLESDLGMWEEVRAAAAYGRQPGAGRRELPPSNEASSETPLRLEGNWDHLQLPPSTETTVPSQQNQLKRQKKRNPLGIVGIAATSALVAVVGFNLLSKTPLLSPFASQPSLPPDIKTESVEVVTTYATERLSKSDLDEGLKAVEELLNRNELSNAENALSLIPQNKANDSFVNFLKGRLAWQSLRRGDSKYSLDNARRFWESAVKDDPNSLTYKNALGFAYYAEGNLIRANDAWFKALDVAVKEQKTSATPLADNDKNVKPIPKDALTAYAGLALGLYKTAYKEAPAKRQQYLSEAIKLRQKVLRDDSAHFQPKELSQDWMWTDKAIQDWQKLLRLKLKRPPVRRSS